MTVSSRQVEMAVERVKDAGLAGQVDIRLQDYRDVDDGPFDAISSIGMFEHVGRKRLGDYFSHLRELLVPQGRLLNHGICRPARGTDGWPVTLPAAPWSKRTFINRFVFPDGELHELGSVIAAMQQQGFEVRHSEALREHYALTLRGWVANLEARWDDAVRLAGLGRARVWHLYTAACAIGFEAGRIQIHQVLAVPFGRRSQRLPAPPCVLTLRRHPPLRFGWLLLASLGDASGCAAVGSAVHWPDPPDPRGISWARSLRDPARTGGAPGQPAAISSTRPRSTTLEEIRRCLPGGSWRNRHPANAAITTEDSRSAVTYPTGAWRTAARTRA